MAREGANHGGNNSQNNHARGVDGRTKGLLVKAKEFTRLQDRLSQQRRELPWCQRLCIRWSRGPESPSQLFAGQAGCPHSSFWADDFDGIDIHLAHRDLTFVAISHAPLAKLAAFKQRMGWTFKRLSAGENGFNYDYFVSFRMADIAKGTTYHNYAPATRPLPEHAGMCAFCKSPQCEMFHFIRARP